MARFTVHPWLSSVCHEFMDGNDVAGDDRDPIRNGFSLELSWYYYNGYAAMVDPFHVVHLSLEVVMWSMIISGVGIV